MNVPSSATASITIVELAAIPKDPSIMVVVVVKELPYRVSRPVSSALAGSGDI